MPSVDDFIAALPEVSLRLVYIGQHRCGTWGCYLDHTLGGGDVKWGEGDTPQAAIAGALRMAGVQIDG